MEDSGNIVMHVSFVSFSPPFFWVTRMLKFLPKIKTLITLNQFGLQHSKSSWQSDQFNAW